jgi:hypothetical protein
MSQLGKSDEGDIDLAPFKASDIGPIRVGGEGKALL